MKWYLKAIRNYAEFDGRACRKEYWMFTLFNLIVYLVLAFFEGSFKLFVGEGTNILASIYFLAVFIPGLAVAVRRLHDTGRSGRWLLLSLIPGVGLILIVFLVQDSQKYKNKYGPNPKKLQKGHV